MRIGRIPRRVKTNINLRPRYSGRRRLPAPLSCKLHAGGWTAARARPRWLRRGPNGPRARARRKLSERCARHERPFGCLARSVTNCPVFYRIVAKTVQKYRNVPASAVPMSTRRNARTLPRRTRSNAARRRPLLRAERRPVRLGSRMARGCDARSAGGRAEPSHGRLALRNGCERFIASRTAQSTRRL